MTYYLQLLSTFEEYYQGLLIVQYADSPKAKATIKLLVDLLYACVILLQIQDAFDWKTATDAQLDIIGKWVGVDRFYTGQVFNYHPWFSLPGWNDTPDNEQGGFSEFSTFESLEGGFLDYQYVLPTQNTLNTGFFRQLIGLKIIKNSINCTCKSIDDAIWDYFGGDVYTTWDLTNRKLIYSYPKELQILMDVALEKSVLPCPPTVTIQLQEIINNG